MDIPSTPILRLGEWRALRGATRPARLELPAHHLVTHGVIVGMTGSGKTGLAVVIAEEALRCGIPVLVLDVKGDLPNLLLALRSFAPTELLPWVEGAAPGASTERALRRANKLAEERRRGLQGWSISEFDLAAYCDGTAMRILTPGASAGEPLHLLSSLERPSPRWASNLISDRESARESLCAAVSLLLRLVGRDADPTRSREHVLLSVLAERRLGAGLGAPIEALLEDLDAPPVDRIGALDVDAFVAPRDRRSLAAALNALIASPTLASWRTGVSLDIASFMSRHADGRTPATIVSVAHLNDEDRTHVLAILLDEFFAWVRSLPGSQHLRGLLVFDEVAGFLPPRPANPPTKPPLLGLLKQARAFGVGVLIATQNPIDYRALSNAGLWWVGRLQTDADRARVIESIETSMPGQGGPDIDETVARLASRWFVMRDMRASVGPVLMQPRWTLSLMRGPMTRHEISLARALHDAVPALPAADESA